jgi:hypothetical protein
MSHATTVAPTPGSMPDIRTSTPKVMLAHPLFFLFCLLAQLVGTRYTSGLKFIHYSTTTQIFTRCTPDNSKGSLYLIRFHAPEFCIGCTSSTCYIRYCIFVVGPTSRGIFLLVHSSHADLLGLAPPHPPCYVRGFWPDYEQGSL